MKLWVNHTVYRCRSFLGFDLLSSNIHVAQGRHTACDCSNRLYIPVLVMIIPSTPNFNERTKKRPDGFEAIFTSNGYEWLGSKHSEGSVAIVRVVMNSSAFYNGS